MDAISYILSYIRRYIPREVLTTAFTMGIGQDKLYMTSVDSRITGEVIRGFVLQDLDVIGGIEMFIPLDGIQPMFDPYGAAIFKVPLERTNDRLILNVLGIGSVLLQNYNGVGTGTPQLPYGSNSVNKRGSCQPSNYLLDQSNRIAEAMGNAPVDYNPNVSLLAPNVVLCQGFRFYSGQSIALQCNIQNDDNLNNFTRRSYEKLAEACLLATKVYIYNKLIIAIGEGVLSGGQDLGRFTSIVEDYSSAEEDYKNYRHEVLGAMIFLNDRAKKSWYIDTIFNANF